LTKFWLVLQIYCRFYNYIFLYLCNQCLSPLKLWVWIPLIMTCTRYNFMW
jgi:hypothetical protein